MSARLVRYVIPNGEIRPFMIVQEWPDSKEKLVNGLLFRDGPNDNSKDGGKSEPMSWKPSVQYDKLKRPNTWHEVGE